MLENGINGIIGEIDNSLKIHKKQEETEFLGGIKKVAETLIEWAHICSGKAAKLAYIISDNDSFQERVCVRGYRPERPVFRKRC